MAPFTVFIEPMSVELVFFITSTFLKTGRSDEIDLSAPSRDILETFTDRIEETNACSRSRPRCQLDIDELHTSGSSSALGTIDGGAVAAHEFSSDHRDMNS